VARGPVTVIVAADNVGEHTLLRATPAYPPPPATDTCGHKALYSNGIPSFTEDLTRPWGSRILMPRSAELSCAPIPWWRRVCWRTPTARLPVIRVRLTGVGDGALRLADRITTFELTRQIHLLTTELYRRLIDTP